MCVFNGVMVDSGTIQFIASQEMARKQGHCGRAARSSRGPSPCGVNKQHHSRIYHSAFCTGYSECARHILLKCEGWTGYRVKPACSQARQGMAAGNFLWKPWYRTTTSTPLKLAGLDRMQVKESWPPFQCCIRGTKHKTFNMDGRGGCWLPGTMENKKNVVPFAHFN